MGGATRSGTAEPTSRDQNTRQRRGQGKGDNKKCNSEEEMNGAQTEAARQSRAAPPATKQNEDTSMCPWTEDHTCHAQRGRWRWMGRTELDGR